MVAETGNVPVLTAVKEGRLPFPLAARPIAVLLFVHEYVVDPPVRLVVNVTTEETVPLQIVMSAGSFNSAVGFTMTLRVICGPGQKVEAGPAGVMA